MLDPVTLTSAVATATTAFNAVKRAFEAGRDIETMSQDISRWMSAVSDVDNVEKQAKNPTFIRKLMSGNNIQDLAFQAVQSKKTLADQRETLKNYVRFKMGTQYWEDLLKEEGRLRKLRQEQIYAKQQFQEKVIQYVVLAIVLCVGCGILYAFVYGLIQFDRGKW
tara:strand:- start:842 stop:1336 length:495 start_codon:yes stop_codon:yes gene_type:complete